ncbi:hypothetical protein [uncultured Sphingomonas sp.]|uniref:hypothetical protein n=1 Tax=uncultured Sphingomonas sp. TaxID=158754 RepID=UPI00261AB16D|nr:hypothetical protein [uncultured Sphingomonas sp.]
MTRGVPNDIAERSLDACSVESPAPEPLWKCYLPMVDAACPDDGAIDRHMRCRMMFIRDQATRARRTAGNWASDQILATIEQIGLSQWATPMETHDLQALGESMSDLFTIAAKVSVRWIAA